MFGTRLNGWYQALVTRICARGGSKPRRKTARAAIEPMEPRLVLSAVATIHATDLGGVYDGKRFAATGYVAGTNGVKIGAPLFSYYLASDTTFSDPLPAAPIDAGSYVFVATFAGKSGYGPTRTSAAFTIKKAPSIIHAADLGGDVDGHSFPATGYVAGVGGVRIGKPTFSYFNASDTALSDPLPGPPSLPGNYVFIATFAGNSDYLSTQTSARFSIGILV